MNLRDLTHPALAARLAADSVNPIHARAIWTALYQRDTPLDPSTLPAPARRWIETNTNPADEDRHLPQPILDTASADGLTRKLLLRLHDGPAIETVLMGYPGRWTACLSTQAGCAMGCVFCATGQGGFTRHLRPGEIIAQVRHVQAKLTAAGQGRLRNIVLMGMGEPLHNYSNTMDALDILAHPGGIGIGPRRVTLSTVGLPPGIRRLADEDRAVNLAVSLHGATEDERAALVPASRRWPLAEVMDACRHYHHRTGRRILFAWTLIAGQNDTPAHAQRLARLLEKTTSHLDAQVNLIPLNPTDGYDGQGPRHDAIRQFQDILRQHGIPSTTRQRRGIDVAAGCGQLSAAAK